MQLNFKLLKIVALSMMLISCQDPTLVAVSVKDFQKFIDETGYITDAEKYGWSIVQKDIHNFDTRENANWNIPDSIHPAQENFAVTQVSYNDAKAYAAWIGGTIPTYSNYWKIAQKDTRPINENSPKILPLDQSSIIGNVWEITAPNKYGRIRLAGGSYLCNKNSCNGTNPERELYVDQITGNTHISFCIIK